MCRGARSSRILLLALTATFTVAVVKPTSLSAQSPMPTSPDALVKTLDERLAAHWSSLGIVPAESADSATLFRRTMLDLCGRIPTRAEWEAFVADPKPLAEKHLKTVDALLAGPEFPLYWGTVLDEMIQGRSAGNAEFIDWLRRRLREGRGWNELFREMMVGPWNTAETKPAQRFLDVRAKEVDRLTTDAARVFFGVDVSCARCHDHPLVSDWKQDHYYGMVSFFHRTTGGGQVGERFEGDVQFRTAGGEQKTAKVMFLSGAVLPGGEPKAKVSRRQQLVEAAMEEKTYFARSFVNRVWHQLLGRGLVTPVDQMHSGNSSRVPGLMEWLGDDFAASNYDIRRLIRGILLSRSYLLSSRHEGANREQLAENYAMTALRPLTRRQFALSLLTATERATFTPADTVALRTERVTGVAGLGRIQQYLAAEKLAQAFEAKLDSGADGQSSTSEALFVSNSPDIHRLFEPEAGTLGFRLKDETDARKLVEAAFRNVRCRPPIDAELDELVPFLKQSTDRSLTLSDLIWALAINAEFRFRH